MTVRLNGTLDRTRGYVTPVESDAQCPYFKKRFFEWGVAKERRACCEMVEGKAGCDYRLVQTDGTPICARYVHGPQYEDIRDTGKVIDDTFVPIPYVEGKKTQKLDPDGKPLFWDTTQAPPVETDVDTGEPIMVDTVRQWLTTQYTDTHEKKFRIRDGVMSWYHDV